ncbi:methylase [Enterococcus florum]|uniref:Methylase n=1 Tax=Enterococcus florum TaxID=2480627 RepID=A0A4P5PRL1_9ENTE|nr:class I SAM-dependent methyltransferase [Enterococcus florum]GCF95403.1 methylase [Enterococcus florum]
MKKSEVESFWDAFAKEYETIQQESRFPIAMHLYEFLIEQQILPCKSFLDMAGGTGRYMEIFQQAVADYDLVDLSSAMLAIAKTKILSDRVNLIHQEQSQFLEKQNKVYDIVFAAMTPSIQTKNDFFSLLSHGRKWGLFLRLVSQEDSLFSPFEEKVDEPNPLNEYRTYLDEEKVTYQTKVFSFSSTETVKSDFFQAYFQDEWPQELLEARLHQLFDAKKEARNEQSVRYELLLVPLDQENQFN